MNELTDKNFGLLIAYLIPGLITVWALSDVVPQFGQWLAASPTDSPTIGGFLYATIASVGAGLLVSAVRWLVIDTIHHRTGIAPPALNFHILQKNYAAFVGAVTNHYRYYQAYANSLIALAAAVTARRVGSYSGQHVPAVIAIGLAAIAVILFVASRDALKKYYARTDAILKSNYSPTEIQTMTNGWHPAGEHPTMKELSNTETVVAPPISREIGADDRDPVQTGNQTRKSDANAQRPRDKS